MSETNPTYEEMLEIAEKREERNKQYHPLVYKILYSRLKTPWDSIIDECVLDKNGNIDNQWANNLDDEQCLRMDVAAFIQDYFNTLNNPQTVEK